MPSDLDVGGLDVHRFFSAHEVTRAAHYRRFVEAIWASHLLAELIALVVLTRRAPGIVRTSNLGRIGAGVVVAMIVLVTLWFLSLPFGMAQRWWDARYRLAPNNYYSWIYRSLIQLSIEAVVVFAAVVIVLALAARLGDRWWLAGAPVLVGCAAAFPFISGYAAVLGTHGLPANVRADVRVLEQRERVPGTPVHVRDVSDVTYRANAFATGFGPSANVVLWNTLLDGSFTRGEIRVVVAHEFGHVAHRHVLKAVGWTALLLLPVVWLVTLAARVRGGIADPRAIPFVLLTLVMLGFLAAPFVNAVSRRYEAEADWSALNATHDGASARKLFIDFQRTSLQEPNPPTWDYLWLENHPTIAQRIAMVQAWLRMNALRPSPAGS